MRGPPRREDAVPNQYIDGVALPAAVPVADAIALIVAAQFPHRDEAIWRGPTGEIEYLVNVMWPISPFRAENGAKLIWPRSHNAGSAVEDARPLAVEADPGSAILFLGSTLYGAGANMTGAIRRGIIVSYCLGWLKPYENQWLTYPPDAARAFDPELAVSNMGRGKPLRSC